MRNTLLLLDPHEYIHAKVYEEKERELNIAVEIFLAQSCVRIHYADLMDDVDPSLASKSRLINWLNDYVRDGEVKREGVISLYRKERRGHFRGNAWVPLYFPQFLLYAKERLTDADFLRSRKLADVFRRSFADREWLAKASAVMGLKLLESLHENGMLYSVVAKSLLDRNRLNRELLDKSAKIVGKASKTGHEGESLLAEIKETYEDFFKKQWENELKRLSGHEEYRILKRYEADIRHTVLALADNAGERFLLGAGDE